MANMIKLPWENGGHLFLNVDEAYDATLVSTSSLSIDYNVNSNPTGNKWMKVTLDFVKTGADFTQTEANLLLDTIAKASQAPNSQPVFSPQGYSLKDADGMFITEV